MGLQAGKLDRRVTLQTNGPTQDTTGQPIESWTEIDEVWAEVVPLRGREFLAAQQVNADVTTRFLIRYRSDVGPADRVLYDSVGYDILSLTEVGRQEGLEILAKRNVAT